MSLKTSARPCPGPRVVMVAPIHPADDVRIFEKETKTLAAQGYSLRLLVRAERRETVDGIEIIPAWAPFRGPARVFNFPFITLQALLQRGAVYHLHNPDCLPVALLLRLCGRKIVYDTHEDFAYRILIREWIPAFLRPLVARAVVGIERLVARLGEAIVVTQSDLVERYGAKALFLDNRPVLKTSAFSRARDFAATLPEPECLTLIYIGGVTQPKGLDTMIDLTALVNEHMPCRLRLIGPFAEEDRREAEKRPGWQYTEYLGRLQMWQAWGHVINARIGLVVPRDVGDQAKSNTNKLYEYMALATPFIASGFPHWRESVKDCQAGLFHDPDDVAGMAASIIALAKDSERLELLGGNGESFIRDHYNWELASTGLIDLYRRICPLETGGAT